TVVTSPRSASCRPTRTPGSSPTTTAGATTATTCADVRLKRSSTTTSETGQHDNNHQPQSPSVTSTRGPEALGRPRRLGQAIPPREAVVVTPDPPPPVTRFETPAADRLFRAGGALFQAATEVVDAADRGAAVAAGRVHLPRPALTFVTPPHTFPKPATEGDRVRNAADLHQHLL